MRAQSPDTADSAERIHIDLQRKKSVTQKLEQVRSLSGSAVEHGSSFSVIHLETSTKIDVFIEVDDPYACTAMGRRRADTLLEETMSRQFFCCSAEDIILQKLQWYESGGRASERQWLDVPRCAGRHKGAGRFPEQRVLKALVQRTRDFRAFSAGVPGL